MDDKDLIGYDCLRCVYARWHKTNSGAHHPSGEGVCEYPYKIPELPASMYWVGGEPKPCGGHINRKEGLKSPCPHKKRISDDDPRVF